MRARTHLDLFSGIGGFALAAQWAGFQTVAFCEIAPFCHKVLRKHFPGVPIIEDIRTLSSETLKEVMPGEAYVRGPIDLVTGGFP
jgi:DNA (cytosine-5)-methyltransferase 1